MLPCQTACPTYQEGCHKTCARWRIFQERQCAQRQEKKQYLQLHNVRCTQTIHQYLAMIARYPMR